MHEFLPGFQGSAISSDYTDWKGLTPAPNSHRTTEWLRGEALCTYKGKYHLAWYTLPFIFIPFVIIILYLGFVFIYLIIIVFNRI